MRKWVGSIVAVAVVFSLVVILFWPPGTAAQYNTEIYTMQGGAHMVVGSSGILDVTGIFRKNSRSLVLAQYTGAPGATSATVAISGIDSDDYLLATMNTSATTYLVAAVPYSGSAELYWAADPGKSVTVTLEAWEN